MGEIDMKLTNIHLLFDGLSAQELETHTAQYRRYSTAEKNAIEARRLPVVFQGAGAALPGGFTDTPAVKLPAVAASAAAGVRTTVVGFVQKLAARHVSPL